MSSFEQLASAISDWDHKQKRYIQSVYQNYVHQTNFVEQLVQCCKVDNQLQTGATWLIKHHLEQGELIVPAVWRQYIQLADDLKDWASQIHFLQSLPFAELHEEDLPHVEKITNKAIKSDVRILRAWGYHGLFEMSKILPPLREEVRLTCEQLLEKEETPAVKARARNILKALKKLK